MSTIPGGPEKGTTIDAASQKTLTYWYERISAALADGSSKYPDRDRAWVAAAKVELDRRAGGGQPAATPKAGSAPAAQAQRFANPGTELVVGSFRDAQTATDALRRNSEMAHLVTPATACPTLPEGCEVAMSAVLVDVPNETYPLQGGKRGLGKSALDRIAAAAGIDWDPLLSCRLDDGSDPHYCHYRAVGRVRSFDGAVRTLTGEVEIDARNGSPQIDEIIFKAERSEPKRDPRPQIMELRKFLLRHAESKAKNRAVRSQGVRTSYTPDELKRPFAVARLMFTGQTTDPEASRYYRERIADSFLGARAAMYPAPAPEPRQVGAMPHQVAQVVHHRPPAVGVVPADAEAIEVQPTTPEPSQTEPWDDEQQSELY